MQPFRIAKTSWMAAVLPGALALLAVFALQLAGFAPLTRVGQLVFDAYLRAAPRDYEPAPVRVIDIDEESIRRYGQWPWPRTEIALLTDRLTQAGAAVIALDIVFSEPDRTSPPRIAERLRRVDGDARTLATLESLPDNDEQLARAFGEQPIVTGFFLTNDPRRVQAIPKAGFAVSGTPPGSAVPAYRNAVLPLAELEQAAVGNGSVTLAGDSDGIIRKAPLLMRQGDQLLPSLSLEALRVAQGAGAIFVKSSDGSGTFGGGRKESEVVSIKVGQFEVPTTESGALWMYYTRPQPDRIVPAWQVLSGELSPDEMAERFGGHILFVGAGAIGLRDLVSTPIQDRDLGVMVHAQAAEQIILGKYLTRPDWAVGLERSLVLALGLLLVLLLPRLGAARGAAFGIALGGATLAGSWYAFTGHRFLLDPTYPLLAVLAVYVTETVVTYYREEKRRSYIHQAFDRYLSPELVKRIADDPGQLELGGEERQMTVLFCDIRSFSRISEKLPPQDIIRFLIAFLTPMCNVLLERRATIDKFIGDAILAFWNAPLDDPDQYENAARASLGMIRELERLNAEMPEQDEEPWPGDVKIGIGLNSGPCCVGNMGSAQRLSYSLIGDTVNLASRIEGQTKFYGVQIAIGSALAQKIPQFATVVIDLVRVIGRDAPEEISALVGDERIAQTADFQRFAEKHAAMLQAYRSKNWESATQWLDETEADAKNLGLGRVHALYRERVAALALAPPPEDWDGVYSATEK
ncbi:MAG: adenylate/guanylate cyclase domain-containing protein [Novosphingobium sp.]|nr:adenylate/guanylate cyclase domain-containing protein [Novosphingobium sp.]MCP5402223.1 adenylate/guanylate cyclase domain-containing protein [Novosphingobium sp.]